MAGGDGANGQTLEPFDHRFHLPCHRRHQAVVEVAAVFFAAVAVGLGEGLHAEVGGEKLAAHQ